MRAAAARILLDPDTGLDDVERRGPGTHGTLDVIGAWSVENLEEALLMLEHALRVCREAGLCQSRGQNAITSAVADVQRLRHGAEVRLDARGERRGERERHAGLVRVQSHQSRRRRGCAEGAERRGRMPALGVVMEVDGERDLGFDLESRDVGEHEVATRYAKLVGERKERRQHRYGRMSTHRVAAVVEVERVRGRAVHVSGIEDADPPRRAEDQARTRRQVERACEEARRVLAAAGERDADGVEYPDLRPLDRFGRQVPPAQRRDARAEKAGEAAQLSL